MQRGGGETDGDAEGDAEGDADGDADGEELGDGRHGGVAVARAASARRTAVGRMRVMPREGEWMLATCEVMKATVQAGGSRRAGESAVDAARGALSTLDGVRAGVDSALRAQASPVPFSERPGNERHSRAAYR